MNNHPLEEAGVSSRFIDACVLVIFGATGDLTARKLLPAIYNLTREGQLPSQFAVVGVARRPKTNEQFREEMKQAINKYSRVKPVDEAIWKNFEPRIFYHCTEFHEEKGYEALGELLKNIDTRFGTKGNRVFYLSTQPSFFPLICEKLHATHLIYPKDSPNWSRLIIEKPFGHDLQSALDLQKELLKYTTEEQIYRIDHYLGKETVQNLMVFRFANSLFESLWNSRYIDHVQITVAEDIGIGRRGAYWEEAGWLRDMIQNHMTQLLTLITMEPPVHLDANSIRDEKVKVLRAIRPFSEEDLKTEAVRGQYSAGFINGENAIGYRQEENVNPNSSVETFVALRLFIDNWRWQGVPFFLRGGKRLPKKATEIAITFKLPPAVLFQESKEHEPNVLTIRIQPDEGIGLKINCKVPGPTNSIQPVKMDFRYGSYFGMSPPEAYERLILDCMSGDTTLFAREDEVFASWTLYTPLLEYWKKNPPTDLPNYQAGTWGPKAADNLIGKDGRKWRIL